MSSRAKQEKLEGFTDEANQEIVDAAIAYADARDARMAAMKPELELKQTLIDVLKRYGKTVYESQDLTVEIIPGKEKVKVRKGGDDGEDGDEAD